VVEALHREQEGAGAGKPTVHQNTAISARRITLHVLDHGLDHAVLADDLGGPALMVQERPPRVGPVRPQRRERLGAAAAARRE
jgi:hypothetical protein